MVPSKGILVYFTLALLVTTHSEAAQVPYCAFEIAVHDADGTPASVGIFAYQDSRRFKEIVTDASGIARICDTPKSGPVEFQIGGRMRGSGCGMVTVDASPQWLTTRRLSVDYESLCPETFFMPKQCYFMLRVLGPGGAPISGVTLSSKAPRSSEDGPAMTDIYGRLFRVVPEGEQMEGLLTKAGMAPETISLRCERRNMIPKDRTIVLKKADK